METQNKESDTPRTDAAMFTAWRWDTDTAEYRPHGIAVPAPFARQLERELAEATRERDELRAKYRMHHDEAERLTRCLEKCKTALESIK